MGVLIFWVVLGLRRVVDVLCVMAPGYTVVVEVEPPDNPLAPPPSPPRSIIAKPRRRMRKRPVLADKEDEKDAGDDAVLSP